MLVRFSSTETESITMFGDVALQLIRMMGGSGDLPGAIGAKDIPEAVKALRTHLSIVAAAPREPQDEDEEKERPVAITTRALPLIDLLERAAAADVPVMWERQ